MCKLKLYFLLGTLIAISGCGSAGKHRPSAQPPVATLPPAPRPVVAPAVVLPPRIQAPESDAVSRLIDQAESLYASGMDDYRSGNLDKAREKFDQALGLLLDSKADVETNERLGAEFDKLVENIYTLDVATTERGDTLAERKYVPAPIESLQGLTFPVDPNVKQRVQEEVKSVHSELPLVSNELVAGVITYFQNRGSGFIYHVLTRVGAYQPIISQALRKEGVPEELMYLAAGESGYSPFARSRKGAVGIWQFMLGTGMLYGLRKDRWVDDREDPVKSTEAAARHLKDLYQTFGDWYLAMAAYDTGPGTVQKAIEKTGYADFWMLRKLHALPAETENYVPIFLATALIAKDPKNYGFDIQPDPPIETDKEVVYIPTDLRLVAELIDHPVEDLIKLNPSLLSWATPPNDPEFVLNLPKGTGETFEKAIAMIPPNNRVWWRTHKVAGGETLSSIAGHYRISTVALARVNQVDRRTPLKVGTRLVLPFAAGDTSSLIRVRERGPRRAIHYRVKPGDTVELIADRFDATPYQIRRWNQMKSSRLIAGQTLRVYVAGGNGGGSRARRRRAPRTSAPSSAEKKKAS